MSTYSINISTPTESTSYKLPDYLTYLLNRIPDNQSKIVNPRDVRDVILSLWSSVPFKETSSYEDYVGIDTGDTSTNSDIKNKILLGKRSFSGTYSYSTSHDILGTSSFFTNDTDIFIYNTKIDTDQQTTTRVSLLSGSNFNILGQAPYIQSQLISGLNQTLSLDFVNPSGDIDVRSTYGTVSINEIEFPTLAENSASASNDKVLFWDDINNKLYWDFISLPTLSTIGTSSDSLMMYGSPTNINGYSLDFTDNRRCPVQIGDIIFGDSFQNISLSEMLRRFIFDYLPPTCDIEILSPYDSGYAEVGTYPNPIIEYTINKKTLPTLITGLSNMIPGSYPPITSTTYSTITSQSQGIVISPITATSTEFKITVTDGTQSASASTTLTGIYPYFYGFSTLPTMTTIGLAPLTKLVEPMSDKTVDITGTGNLYFIYPKDYGTLSAIYDELNNNIFGSFSVSDMILSSPTGLWASEEYYVYQWDSVPQIGPPSVNYQFVY